MTLALCRISSGEAAHTQTAGPRAKIARNRKRARGSLKGVPVSFPMNPGNPSPLPLLLVPMMFLNDLLKLDLRLGVVGDNIEPGQVTADVTQVLNLVLFCIELFGGKLF